MSLGIILGVCTGVAVNSFKSTNAQTIVIDAGHGGVDVGVNGVNTGVKESEINLYITKYLRGYFVNAGFNVVLTRSTQGGLYGTSTKGFKLRDMKKRREIIQDSLADMVISIHQNKCALPSKRGAIVFYESDSESGKTLAETIQNELNKIDDYPTQSALAGDYYILKCTQSPSVIVECGFLSNEYDESLLTTEEFQKKIAYTIFKGAVAYYS
jgi:N-acetylmuramoyl-L-alanine amidase